MKWLYILSLPSALFLYLSLSHFSHVGVHLIPTKKEAHLTSTLVISRLQKEDVSWAKSLPESVPHLSTAIYTVDDLIDNPIPANKGHEVMVYLTHIINHYHNLSDVTFFMHAHRWTMHNNPLQKLDSLTMVKQASVPRVLREGYFNMNCMLPSICFEPVHLSNNTEDGLIVHQAWMQLFPGTDVPYSLAQPCCAQFAVSRDAIHKRPLQDYVHMRNWLLHVALNDFWSGRIFEWVWHYIFTGQHELCVAEHVCYCDGFGVCFQDADHYALYQNSTKDVIKMKSQLARIDRIDQGRRDGDKLDKDEGDDETVTRYRELLKQSGDEAEALAEEFKENLRKKKDELERTTGEEREAAFERGKDPQARAMAVGRAWEEGDGY